MDQFEPLESPYARSPGRWPTRPGRIAAIIVVAGLLLQRSVFRPPQPLPIFDLFATAALVLLLADRLAAVIVGAGLLLNIAVRSIFHPEPPLPVADLFFTLALALLVLDRLRAGFDHFGRLEIARVLSFSLPGVSGLRDSLMTRRGEAADLSVAPPPSEWSAATSRRDDALDTASRDEAVKDEDDDEDPWR